MQNEADVYASRAVAKGVPVEAIVTEDRATNSGENVLFTYHKLKEVGVQTQKITLVHKPYMLRRAYATFMKQWPDSNKPDIICSAIPQSFEEYIQNRDYPFSHVVDVLVGDLQRIREYPKSGFQIEQVIPDDVWGAYEELVRRGCTKHLLDR